MSHLKEIIIGTLVIVLVAVSYSGYKVYTQHALNKAKKELGSILVLKDNNQKISKLNNMLGEAPSNIKQAIRLEMAKLYINTKQYKKSPFNV